MLGGSYWISLLRNGMGVGLMTVVFLLLDRPRFSMKKTLCCYVIFGLLAAAAFGFWYLLNRENFVRFAGMLAILVVGVFCICMSRDTLYLSLYKLTLGFYLLSVTVFCGIDISRMWFAGNLWVDVVVRLIIMAIAFVIVAKVRSRFLKGIDYLREEMDWFSAVTVLLSILIAALVAFWPGPRVFSLFRFVRTMILFFYGGNYPVHGV